jgi:DNA-binding XRE family transcriptional regulator
MEKQGTTQFFDHNSFYSHFFEDLERARGLVIIHSPYLSARQIERFEPYLQKCIKRGVRVCVFAQEPADWNKRLNQWSSRFIRELESAIQQLQSMKVHVTLRARVHQKIAVVDEGILWNGSMNILSHFDTSECMERWSNREIVLQVMKAHRLDCCESCLLLSSQTLIFSPEMSQPERLQLIGKCVERRRREMGLSQGELAKAAGVQQNLISEVESGKRKVQIDTLDKILEVLQFQLLPVPWRLTRSMTEMLESNFEVDPTALIGIRE